jgi:hypothetical protein
MNVAQLFFDPIVLNSALYVCIYELELYLSSCVQIRLGAFSHHKQ